MCHCVLLANPGMLTYWMIVYVYALCITHFVAEENPQEGNDNDEYIIDH